MKGRILVVDDEDKARESLADILELEGYQVTAKADGASALEVIEKEEFDLILLDLKMPGMDGVEVLVNAREMSPSSRIIMLTAHGSLASAIEALRQGAHDYMLKPASPNDILASVARGINDKTESERKRRLLSQMEVSIQELKDAEGVADVPESPRPVFSFSNDVKVDLERREIWRGDEKVSLTPTEGKLMKVLLDNRGRVLSHRELVMLVQGYQTNDWEAPEIMRPLVSRLRRKLAPFTGEDQWIINVRGTGYLFEVK